MDPLAPFSKKTRGWFERAFAGPTPAQTAGWPAIATGGHVLIQAPTGSGKTLAAFLYGIDQLDRAPGDGPAPALRLAAEGAQLRRRAEPARAARGIKSDLRVGVRTGDTTPEGAARAGEGAAGHPDHDARVALPDADLAGARDAARDRHRDRRRGARRRRHQARRPSRALARAARRAARAAGAADRPLGDAAPARGDRPLRLRRSPDPARRRRHTEGARPRGRRPGRGPARAGSLARARPAGRERRRRDGVRLRVDGPLDLALDLSRPARARAAAPLDDRLRQQPPPGRAARGPAQRAGRGRDRACAPRLAGARAAGRDRGGPEGGPDPVPRRDLEPRARDRHGRRRPRDPGREPEVGRARAPAGRPRRPRARLDLEGPHLPQVPRRPARVGGRREGDARR